MFNKLCIIGVGLIGGSVAKAARANGLAKTIVGYGREQDTVNLQTAKRLGVIDEFYIDNVGWVSDSVTQQDSQVASSYAKANPTYEVVEHRTQQNTNIAEALKDADCVLIATPVASIEAIFTQLKPFWSDNTIYTDVGSTKSSVLAAAERVFGFIPDNLVAAHPIAGAKQNRAMSMEKVLLIC